MVKGFSEVLWPANQGVGNLRVSSEKRPTAALRGLRCVRRFSAPRGRLVALGVLVLTVIPPAIPAMAVDDTTPPSSRFSQLIVLAMTILALGAAVVAGRRALHSPPESGPVVQPELSDIDLMEPLAPTNPEPKSVVVFERVFLVILLLYALFDRGFAWFHIPGTPLFVGELALGFGVVAMASSRVPMGKAIRESAPLKALVVWMGWGFAFFMLQLPQYGIDAVRDSALWYYAITAVFVTFLLLSDPSRFARWAEYFRKALPFLLAWIPFAMALDTLFGWRTPHVPDSVVPLFAHRFGNMAVLSGIAIGFIWLVDREAGHYSPVKRFSLTALATVGFLAAGFQNRGGLVSVTIGIMVMLVFLRQRRGELILAMVGVAVVLSTIAVVSDVRIPISNNREISATQMINNISSVIDPDSGGDRQVGTTQWRLDLWTAVIDDVTADHPIAGFGPGPHLGKLYGVETKKEVPLRNPHNSHVGVLARMGWVGVGLWVIIWLTWAVQLFQLRTWLRHHGRRVEAGFVAWLLVSVLMILINAIFDPTLEGPMVAFWLWTFFGTGVAMPLVYSGAVLPATSWLTTQRTDAAQPDVLQGLPGAPTQ